MTRADVKYGVSLSFATDGSSECKGPSRVKASKDTEDKYDLRPFSDGPYQILSYKLGDHVR